MLLEVGKAAGERRAPGVDDARVRQHQLDEPEVEEVARHLVDEIRFAEQPVRKRLGKIPFAERREFCARQLRDRLRVSRRLSRHLPYAELQRETWNIRQLAGALHLGMACEDLFEQRRA